MEEELITKENVLAAKAAAEEATAQDLRGKYPMACRTLARAAYVYRNQLAFVENERDRLAECLTVAVEMTEAEWEGLSYKERAQLKPMLDCWRAALKTQNYHSASLMTESNPSE